MYCDIVPFFCVLQDVEFLLLFLRNNNVTQEERKFDGFNQIQHESNQIFMNACTISNAEERLRYTTFSIYIVPCNLPAEKKNSEDTYLYT